MSFHSRWWSLLPAIMVLLAGPGLSLADDTGLSGDDSSVLTVYGLFPTEGTLAPSGESAKAAFVLAVSDINAFLTRIGSDTRVTGIVHEMGSDPSSAMEAVEKLHDEGVSMVVTYMSSAQAEAVREYVDTQNLLLLATGTSAVSLSLPGDNILRFNPDDSKQVLSMAEVIDTYGVTTVVPLGRDDLWGRGLVTGVAMNLSGGVTMEDGVWYDPETTSYDSYLTQLDAQVGDILKGTHSDTVMIYAVTMEELGDILAEAVNGRHINLESVRWAGCDGNAHLEGLSGSGEVAEYAYKRNFSALSVSPGLHYGDTPVYRTLKETLGREPNGYSYGIYDAVWVACEALLLHGQNDAATLRDAVTTVSATFVGEAGDAVKNSAGDMIEAHYGLWGMADDAGSYDPVLRAELAVWNGNGDLHPITILPVTG